MSVFDIKNKIALVTGANRGIGTGYVESFVKAGAKRVYATARKIESLQFLVDAYPDIVVPLELDITKENQIKAVKSAVEELDVLVNNAGILSETGVHSEDASAASRWEMETNYFGPLNLTLALTPRLKESDQAAIINVSSIAGISNFPALGTYSVSKAALHSYTQGLRAQLANEGIRVLGVYPGPIDTRMAETFDADKPAPEIVAEQTLEALKENKNEVLPDIFAQKMYAKFLNNPKGFEEALARSVAVAE